MATLSIYQAQIAFSILI